MNINHRIGPRLAGALRGLRTLAGMLGAAGVTALAPAVCGPTSGVHAQAVGAGERLPLQRLSAPIRIVIGGHPAVLWVVRSNDAPTRVLAEVEETWRRIATAVRRDDDGRWRSVSRVDADGIESVQLRTAADGGSSGYLIGWRLDVRAEAARRRAGESRQSLAHRLLPPLAVTLSDLASGAERPNGSAGSEPAGRTLVAWTPEPIQQVDDHLQRRAAALALKPQAATASPRGDPAIERIRYFGTEGVELALTLHKEGTGTALVIHLMETTR